MNDEGKIETQCWICPICFDDHKHPDSYFSYCKLEDLQQMRDMGVEQQRAVNDRQDKEKLEIMKERDVYKKALEKLRDGIPFLDVIEGTKIIHEALHSSTTTAEPKGVK